jgi:hypothetical protein
MIPFCFVNPVEAGNPLGARTSGARFWPLRALRPRFE